MIIDYGMVIQLNTDNVMVIHVCLRCVVMTRWEYMWVEQAGRYAGRYIQAGDRQICKHAGRYTGGQAGDRRQAGR